jgi:hypothetical protein
MEDRELNAKSYSALVAGEFVALWRAFMARFKLAAPVGLVLAVIGCVALWYFTEPKYRSQATLRIIEKRPFVAFPIGETTKGFAETQVELLRGPFIIGQAIDTERLSSALPELREIAGKEDAVPWIAQRLKVQQIRNSDLYEVSFTSRNPESAQKVVAAIVKTYMGYHASESDHHRHRMLDLLAAEQAVRDTDIELKRQKLRDLTKQAGGEDAVVMNMQGGAQGATRSSGRFALMEALQERLVQAEIEVEISRARVESMREETDVALRVPEAELHHAEAGLKINEKIAASLGRRIEIERGRQIGHGDKSLELQFAQDELTNAEEVRRRIAERAVHLTIESRAPSQVIAVQQANVAEFPEGPTLATPLAITSGAAIFAPLILLFVWDVLHLRSRARDATINLDD